MKGNFHELKEHMWLAVMFASIITILHHMGMLGWLDQIIIRASASYFGEVGHVQIAHTNKSLETPVVLKISKLMYEEKFNQTSPLDRAELAMMLMDEFVLPDKHPKMVVIDVDLSPFSSEVQYVAKQETLNQALKSMLDVGVKIILPLPLQVVSENAFNIKFDWMKKICSWNGDDGNKIVAFASAMTSLNAGVSVVYDPTFPSLGMVASDFDKAVDYCGRILNKHDGLAFGKLLLSDSTLLEDYYDALTVFADTTHAYQLPYNPLLFNQNYLRKNIHDFVVSQSPDGNNWLNKVVFVGGAYDVRDSYRMPLADASKNVPGVLIHAATYFSNKNPLSTSSQVIDFVLDVVFGTAMAYLFHWSWHLYKSKQSKINYNSGVKEHVICRALLISNFMLMSMVLWLCLYLTAAYLYPSGVWINVAPMVVGVFLKFIVAARDGADVDKHHGCKPEKTKSPVMRAIDVSVVLLLIVVAVTMIFMH